MLIKGLNECDFVNYKKTSMFIVFPTCDWKCERECGKKGLCQNRSLATAKTIDISYDEIAQRYVNNPITKAIVMGGLEPFDSLFDLYALIYILRSYTEDDIVIYTGYTEEELKRQKIDPLYKYKNIIIKYGRYVPGQEPHYDEVLGVKLASDNQYARRIS